MSLNRFKVSSDCTARNWRGYHYPEETRRCRSLFEVASPKRGDNNPIFWAGSIAIMGQKIKNPAELLKDCFSALEWEYLTHQPDFRSEFKRGCKTLDDFERLSTVGHHLLTDREMADPERSPSISDRKRK
jgi:hypothetical protein